MNKIMEICLNNLSTISDYKLKEEELIIERSRHKYTEAYIELTRDFYLKM